MSLIRRLRAVKNLQAKLDEARKIEDWHTVKALDEIITRHQTKLRGTDKSLRDEATGAVNIQHFGAHMMLQSPRPGQIVRTFWTDKRGVEQDSIYVRTGYRANISRKWLPADARV